MIYNHTPVQTTDATPTRIAFIEIPDNYGGLIDVWVVAKEDTGASGSLRCRQMIGFDKAGTLNLDLPVDLYTMVDDMSVGGFLMQADADENFEILATGLAATVINWTATTDILQINATNLP